MAHHLVFEGNKDTRGRDHGDGGTPGSAIEQPTGKGVRRVVGVLYILSCCAHLRVSVSGAVPAPQ